MYSMTQITNSGIKTVYNHENLDLVITRYGMEKMLLRVCHSDFDLINPSFNNVAFIYSDRVIPDDSFIK